SSSRMVSSSEAFCFEGVDPEIELVFLAMQAKAAIEYLRRQPAAGSWCDGFKGRLATFKDLEVDGFAARIDQPIFGYAGAIVAPREAHSVRLLRRVAHDLQNPVGRAFQTDDGIGILLGANEPQAFFFEGFPGGEETVGLGR